ncbi:MAG: hypothetical protein DI611_12000 [Brachybacterium faecium]|nr:MAG: hypothetical protein DI611_12000 [Brachybacterium faecium]
MSPAPYSPGTRHPSAIAGGPGIRATGSGACCTPVLICSPKSTRLKAVVVRDEHVEVDTTGGIYRRIVTAYRNPDRTAGKKALQAVIDDLTDGVPEQLITLGRTLKRRAPGRAGLLRPSRHQQRPTEAIYGRLEHRRGTALGFRNLAHYVIRALLDTGDSELNYTPICEEPVTSGRRLICWQVSAFTDVREPTSWPSASSGALNRNSLNASNE